MNRHTYSDDDEVYATSAVRSQPSWASLTSSSSNPSDNSPFLTNRTISPASSFTEDDDRCIKPTSSFRLPAPPKLSATSSSISLQFDAPAPPPSTTSPSSTPEPSQQRRWLRTLLVSVLAVIVAVCAATPVFDLLFPSELPPIPNCVLTAQLLATHAELARDVALDVKMLRGKGTRDDFHEVEIIHLARFVRPHSPSASQSLEVVYRTILDIKRNLLMPTATVGTKLHHVATDIKSIVPLLRRVHVTTTPRDLEEEERLKKAFNTQMTIKGAKRIEDLHSTVVYLKDLSEILSHILHEHVLPDMDFEKLGLVDPPEQPRPSWWRRLLPARSSEPRWEGSMGQKVMIRRRNMVDRLKEFSKFVDVWKESVDNVEERVRSWLEAEGLWVYVETLPGPPSPSSQHQHHIHIPSHPHLSSTSSSPPPSLDSILASLQPILTSLLTLTKSAQREILPLDPRTLDTRSLIDESEDDGLKFSDAEVDVFWEELSSGEEEALRAS